MTSESLGVAADFRSALSWLDSLIRSALDRAVGLGGTDTGADPFRGLHISPGEIERLLGQGPEDRLLADGPDSGLAANVPLPRGLAAIADAFALDAFDMAVILIAAAPDLDLRYERFYAYLQDDVNRKRPTVDLALNLLCGSLAAKIARRSHFAADAPLIRHRLVHLEGEAAQSLPPLLARILTLDDQILAALLGERHLDCRLAGSCRLLQPAETPPGTSATEGGTSLSALAGRYGADNRSLVLFLEGADDILKHHAAENIARGLGRPILEADLSLLQNAQDFDLTFAVLLREAWLKDAVLFLRDCDSLRSAAQAPRLRQLTKQLASAHGITILFGTEAWPSSEAAPLNIVPICLQKPGPKERIARWTEELRKNGLTPGSGDIVRALAERYELNIWQIGAAAAEAAFAAPARGETGTLLPDTTGDNLFAAARRQTRHALAELAQHIEPTHDWDDLVLPDEATAQLRELCAQFLHRGRVLEDWGLGRKFSYGTGINALFAGPSGTGKTMAAEIVAGALKLDLFRIDLSRAVSKYIGETEKNLDRIFTAARAANAVLFFDEADALFGKRSEVRDSHDRYANLEISYLLQKMEEHAGTAILATNLRQNLDDAFLRRLTFIVQFPFPDEAHRRRIWAGIWPAQAPLGNDLDFDVLARQHKFSGGSIKNVALAAAYLAAAEGEPIGTRHVLQAAEREYRKLGRSFSVRSDQQSPGIT